jgi:hypothetical protein
VSNNFRLRSVQSFSFDDTAFNKGAYLAVLAFRADRGFPKFIRHMVAAARGTIIDNPTPSNGDVMAKLLPNFC